MKTNLYQSFGILALAFFGAGCTSMQPKPLPPLTISKPAPLPAVAPAPQTLPPATTTTPDEPKIIAPHISPINFHARPWKTYQDPQKRFTFQYPAQGITATQDTYNGQEFLKIGPTVTAKESNAGLPEVYINSVDATSTPSAQVCSDFVASNKYLNIDHQIIGGITFCLVKAIDAGMNHSNEEYFYSGTIDNKNIVFRFDVQSSSCFLYTDNGIPCLESDDAERAREMSLIVDILESIKILK